jgi:tRNA (mo5U34)-methyltransferase
MKDLAELREELVRLGPWHLDVEVTPDLGTSTFLEGPNSIGGSAERKQGVSFISPRPAWERLLKAIYPEGLNERSFLDCACNCGGYSFWAKELGAGRIFGFDVRDHWIRQAKFLLEHRPWPSDGIHFEVLDLYDLPKRDLHPFDITLFKGIFYHLPAPVAGLKLVADLTQEVLIIDTDARVDLPDGMLAVHQEETEHPMSGIYGLNWFPTGPNVMARILDWLGFPETRLTSWMATRTHAGQRFGRLQMVGARERGRLDQLEPVTDLSRARHRDHEGRSR